MKRRSLAFRLTALLAASWFVLFMALGVVIWQAVHSLMREAQADKAHVLATQLATFSLDALLLRDYGTLERHLAEVSATLSYAEVRRADGQLLGSTGVMREGMMVLQVPVRIRADGLEEKVGEVLVQYDPASVRRAAWPLGLAAALSLAVFFSLTFWVLRRLLLRQLLTPLTDLIAHTTPECPPVEPPANAPADVAQLAEAIQALRTRIALHLTQAEDAAQARNEALRRLCSEQRLAAVGQIAGEVAHELNTPLSNMLGYAQSALPRVNDAEVREALEVIESQARRAGQIVRDMLTVARAPAPSLQRLELNELVLGFMRVFTPLARKQGATLILDAEDRANVWADPSRIEQILFNLVSNSVQAGARTIQLRVRAGPTPRLTVADDGPGLPENVRQRLFEPFVTTKPAGLGTGLGLAISQRLAREMGAELVWVADAPGTMFELRFQPQESRLA